jgi:DNA-binding CsgD family transcriptional regulator
MKIEILKDLLEAKIREGLNNSELAKYFNCSIRTINYRKAKYGLQQSNTLTEEEKTSIINLYRSKTPIVDIGKILSRSENTVSRFLVSSGIHTTKVFTSSSEDKQCPYCSHISDTWKSVRGHVASCAYNTHSFYISLTEGPINLINLQNRNYLEIKNLFPNLSKLELQSISQRLHKLGFSTAIVWTEESAKNAINDWVKTYNKIPTARDTYNNPLLPSDHWVKKKFKTWSNFIVYCGYLPNKGYGTNITYKNIYTLRSNFEYYFLDKFLYNKYNFTYEKPYPNSLKICDFYLIDYDIYVELAGGLRPEVITEKINFCIANKLKLMILYPRQVYRKNFSLEKELKNYTQ